MALHTASGADKFGIILISLLSVVIAIKYGFIQ